MNGFVTNTSNTFLWTVKDILCVSLEDLYTKYVMNIDNLYGLTICIDYTYKMPSTSTNDNVCIQNQHIIKIILKFHKFYVIITKNGICWAGSSEHESNM